MNVQDIQTLFNTNDDSSSLLQTDEELIPGEGIDLHLVCSKQEEAVVSTSTNIGVHNSLSPDNVAAKDQPENCCPYESNGMMQSELLPIAEDILPDDSSREGVLECSCSLLQTDEELIPGEGIDLHLVCPEQEEAVVSTSTNIGVHNSLSPDNVAAKDQPENCCPYESNGTMQSEILPIVEEILTNAGGCEELGEEVSAFVRQQKEDPSDSKVLRKFLRWSRYFDPANSCLEDRAAKRLAQKLRKICYLCGKLHHDAKKCPKRRACYTCKRKGHFSVDCPLNVEESERLCLRCGEIGHEISSCNNDYCPDDLKKINCYVCNELGHIICGSDIDISAPTLSCYNCGESGHSGVQCPKPLVDRCGSKPPSICYKCGDEGHVARNCIIKSVASTGHEGGQDGASHLGPETDEQQEHKRARRKSFRHGRARRRKLRGMVVDCMTV